MDEQREEVYERIPWETLERQGKDRQWLIFALAGAVAVGALAYSFMQNRAQQQPAVAAAYVTTIGASAAVPLAPPITVSPPPTTPTVISEADLFALDPQQLLASAGAVAEWFAIEYFSVDGSPLPDDQLANLLPEALPSREIPEGRQVFVDWVGARTVTQLDQVTFRADVVVRSLSSDPDGVFRRLPNRLAIIDLALDEVGSVVVTAPPRVSVLDSLPVSAVALTEPSVEAVNQGEAIGARVIGVTTAVGGELVTVAMVEGIDGVVRPETLATP